MMTVKYLKTRPMEIALMVQIRAAETHLRCGMNARLHAELDINSNSRGQISWYTIEGTLHIPLKTMSPSYIARQISAVGARLLLLIWKSLCWRPEKQSQGNLLRSKTTQSKRRSQTMRMDRAKPRKIRSWGPAAASRTHQMWVLLQARPKAEAPSARLRRNLLRLKILRTT